MDKIHLYRGKNTATGKWVYDRYLDHRLDNGSSSHLIDTEQEFYVVDPLTVGPCSGQKDKKGQLIFAGQMVRDDEGRTGRVVYANAAFRVDFFGGEYLKFNSSLLYCDNHEPSCFEIVEN